VINALGLSIPNKWLLDYRRAENTSASISAELDTGSAHVLYTYELIFIELNRISLKLTYIQMMEESFLFQQFIMRALFNNFSFINNNHPVGITDGAEAVGNDEAGASFHET
jgi:hypothetical protein